MPRTIRSKKGKEQDRKKKTRRRILIPSLVTAVIITCVVVLHQPFMRLDAIVFSGQETLFVDEMKPVVMELLEKKYVGIIPKDVFILYPRKKIPQTLQEKFSRIAHMEMSIENFNVLHITIIEHSPAYLWCNENASEDTCYYFDHEGFVFAEAPKFSPHVYLMFSSAYENFQDVRIGQQIFSRDTFERLQNLNDRLRDGGIDVYRITAGEADDFMLFIDRIDGTRVGSDTHIRLNLDVLNDRILDNLRIVFEQERFTNQFHIYPERLHYIDLRFDKKVFFKFHPESLPSPLDEKTEINQTL